MKSNDRKLLIEALEIATERSLISLSKEQINTRLWNCVEALISVGIFERSRMPYTAIPTGYPEYKPAKELLYKLKRNQKIEDLGL